MSPATDIVHVQRPDLSGLDAMLHVNPNATKTQDRGKSFLGAWSLDLE